MFLHYRSPGLIIKKEDRGEFDRLFTVYTRDFGKVKLLSKSIRKISSKLRVGAEIFYFSDIEFIQAKRHKTLTEALLIEKFDNLRSDLNRFKAANQIVEILEDFVKGQEPDSRVWALSLDSLKRLNDLSFLFHPNLVFYHFLFNFFSFLGYKIQTENCAVCGRPSRENYFIASRGGVVCKNCLGKGGAGKIISQKISRALSSLLAGNFKEFEEAVRAKEDFKIIDSISKSYFHYISNAIH